MVFFLHGDDTYRSREKLRALREKFVRDVDPSGANLVILDGLTCSANDIWGAIAAQSFLVRKRMVVVENLGGAKSDAVQGAVSGLLERIPEDVIVVFWEPRSQSGKPVTKRRAPAAKQQKKKAATRKPSADCFAALRSAPHAQEFIPLIGAELERWTRAYASTVGASLDSAAIRTLAAMVGGDLWRMSREVEKLAAIARTVDGTITASLVREHVEAAPMENIFAFVDALGRGDRRAATLELVALERADADPQYLITMIARQLRLLTMAADLLARGVPDARIASELGIHPFVAQKTIAQARGTSLDALRDLFPRMLELDYALKSSRSPREVLLELFCLEASP